MSDRLIRLMSELGVDVTSASIYSYLLQNGPMPEARLSRTLKLDSKLVRAGLERLQPLRITGTGRVRNRVTHYATDPSLAWLALAAEIVWNKTTTLNPLTSLPSTDNPRLDYVRVVCDSIRQISEKLYVPYSEVSQHQEHDATSDEQLAQLTCEVIATARRTIFAVSKTPLLQQVSNFWATITRSMEKGATYTRIADLDEFISHGLQVKARDMRLTGVNLRMLERDAIAHKFYLVDRRYLAIENIRPRPSLSDATQRGRITVARPIAVRYHGIFQRYLQRSIPGTFVLDQMTRSASRLLARANGALPPADLLWLEDLVGWGQFSRFHVAAGWTSARRSEAEARAISLNLVHRNQDGHLVPVYDVNEVSLRIAYDET